jgi:hypothetical protein
MFRFSPDTPVSELSVEFIEHTPQDVDWDEVDAVQVYAAEVCDECGEMCVMDYAGSNQHSEWLRDDDDDDDEDYEGPLDTYSLPLVVGAHVETYSSFNYSADGHEAYVADENDDLPEVGYGQTGTVIEVSSEGEAHRVSVRFDVLSDLEFFFLKSDEFELLQIVEDATYKKLKPASAKGCTNTLYNEGPMMNYRYDVDSRRVGGAREAAKALARLPMCLVVFPGDDEYLALTGGGMDYSWEICEAYMRLGYLPPAHFIELPSMAGKSMNDPVDAWVIAGCMRTAEVQMGWAENRLERLKEYQERLRKEDERRELRT